ncbi:MAG: glycosyltransferase [Chloroflexi bacterium]|nr:glycosyltransferase [Chloroflexota bacterium]
MISGQDVLILSTQDWDALPTRKHHWARSGPRPVAENLWVFTLPIVLPFFQMIAAINRMNNWLIAPVLRSAMRRIGFAHPILWTYTPHSADFVGHLGERLAVYECVDEFSASRGLVNSQTIAALERELLRRADVVIVTAPALFESKRALAREIHLVPNGVEVEHFARAASRDVVIPPDLARLPKPVVGFVGWIQYWVDFDLISYAARCRPDWSFALIGPVEPLARVDTVRGLPNVYFLGRKPYSEIPNYVAGFDVCINPFVLDALAESVSPIKLFEYLAAGKPVVSVDMAEARPFAQWLTLTRTAEEFLGGLDNALKENGSRAPDRQAAVAGHSWAARFAAVEQIIAARLAGGRA